jgi:hypothetical protein
MDAAPPMCMSAEWERDAAERQDKQQHLLPPGCISRALAATTARCLVPPTPLFWALSPPSPRLLEPLDNHFLEHRRAYLGNREKSPGWNTTRQHTTGSHDTDAIRLQTDRVAEAVQPVRLGVALGSRLAASWFARAASWQGPTAGMD